MASPPLITVSIVSHRQGALVQSLLTDMARVCGGDSLQVLVTLNRPEPLWFQPEDFPWPLTLIHNPRPLGFGANHNQAFRRAAGDYFAVLNPDLRLSEDPFPRLCALLEDPLIPRGVIAPGVLEAGKIADNARRFPTPIRILKRIRPQARRPDYPADLRPRPVDWVAGLFLLFPSRLFATMKGFDEGYFMYCEDVDICARLHLAGQEVWWDPRVSVIHQSRRHSHSRPDHLKWHVTSLLRFFNSGVYAALRQQRL